MDANALSPDAVNVIWTVVPGVEAWTARTGFSQKTLPSAVTTPTLFPAFELASIVSYFERQVLRPQFWLGMRLGMETRLPLPMTRFGVNW